MQKKTLFLTVAMLACAVAARGQVPDKTMKRLVRDLEHREVGRRIDAANLLGKIKAEVAVPDLIGALEDPVWGVRSAAAGALWRIGSPAADSAKAALETRLQVDEKGKVRVMSAGALWRLGVSTKELIPHVRRVLDDESAYARVDAADMLLDMRVAPGEVLPTLERAMASEQNALRKKVVESLLSRSEAFDPLIVTALEDSEWSIRLSAVLALSNGGSPQAVAGLRSATKDRSKVVREAALDALAALEP